MPCSRSRNRAPGEPVVSDGATVEELTALAEELRRDLPHPTPPPPAAMFIHRDIVITCGASRLSPQLITALWVPAGAVVPGTRKVPTR